jgi:transposase
MAKAITTKEFFKRFPTDDACLDHLLDVRYGRESHCPKCGALTKWYRVAGEPAYACKWCGWHVHPMAGTPFMRTRTPLQMWFLVMFLFTTTRNGVSAKEIQRLTGVTYKTAWRMGHEIRKYLGWVDGDAPLGGPDKVVEIDKTFVGGKDKREQPSDKYVVLGMVERGGEVVTRHIATRREKHVLPHIGEFVKPGTRVATDEAKAFKNLSQYGYRHGTVNHSEKEYVRGPVHTNTIENFWLWLKRGINSTHVHVSAKHLPKYLAEFEFRYNLRHSPHLMFDVLLSAFAPPASRAA